VLLTPLPPSVVRVPTGAVPPPTKVLLALLYPYENAPLPGATGTELGSARDVAATGMVSLTIVLLALLYAPLPGATGTELGSARVGVVLSRRVVMLVSAEGNEVEGLVLGAEEVGVTRELVRVLLLPDVELQVALPCATVKGLPVSG